jgi:hypothetical protein
VTDRVHTLTVVLKEDVREDDVESLITAIAHFRGVLTVAGNVADHVSYMAEQRARREIRQKLWDALKDTP